MRNFTKQTQDLPWCYPALDTIEGINYVMPSPAERFDEFEDEAKYLLEGAYGNKETFTKDDMIDAFLKGTSVAYRTLGFEINQQLIQRMKNDQDFYNKYLELRKQLNEILSK